MYNNANDVFFDQPYLALLDSGPNKSVVGCSQNDICGIDFWVKFEI